MGNGSVELIKNIVSSSYEPGDRFLISVVLHDVPPGRPGVRRGRGRPLGRDQGLRLDMEEFIRIVREEEDQGRLHR